MSLKATVEPMYKAFESMQPKIVVQGLHKSFKEHAVLQGVSFTAQTGDVVALMGSSGSGKSTLLRCINLLTIPDTGIIEIDNQLLAFEPNKPLPLSNKQITQLRTKVGMVFQQFNLWAHKTVMENLIEAPIHVLKQSKAEATAKAEELLRKVGLEVKKNHYPVQLSGGQQQRAAIARALMMKPEIMLFDEPTSALDPEMVGEVLTVMQTLANEGMTMLVASHELGFARNVANQAIFLDQGVIVEHGVAKEMFNNPQTSRFNRFLKAVQH